ncbi:hypothetical protein AB4Y36_11965 [Paraburkholderia sp. BR10936]|uniref:hypothetical protein n=1 Tax=Paraburkholderia sp. BR10936 TaxID=3236993 RepID=UPI0034D1BACA
MTERTEAIPESTPEVASNSARSTLCYPYPAPPAPGFYGLHARIERLRHGQDKSLARLRGTLAEPRRAVDVFGALFARRIGEDDLGQMSLATGESLACLNYLMYRGEVKRELRDDGMYWYSRT